MIVKLDEANKLNETLKNQISSQVNKIKSLEEQLIEFKVKVEKLISAKLVVEPNSKDIYIYIYIFFFSFFKFLHLQRIMKKS